MTQLKSSFLPPSISSKGAFFRMLFWFLMVPLPREDRQEEAAQSNQNKSIDPPFERQTDTPLATHKDTNTHKRGRERAQEEGDGHRSLVQRLFGDFPSSACLLPKKHIFKHTHTQKHIKNIHDTADDAPVI